MTFMSTQLEEYDITTNGVSLHVTEQGEGPAILFCHGFPDTSYTWRQQMKAVASAGYRAVAPDMRGYGGSTAPEDAMVYTPLHTAGDLVGLLDTLKIPTAVLVGHDWGATHAWNAALMRPDRFRAVFCLSVPYVPRGNVSVFERMRAVRPSRRFLHVRTDPTGCGSNLGRRRSDDSGMFVLGVGLCSGRRTMESYGSRHVVSIGRLPARCPHGRNRITSTITWPSSSAPAFTAA